MSFVIESFPDIEMALPLLSKTLNVMSFTVEASTPKC
jgi:hypothetical protein